MRHSIDVNGGAFIATAPGGDFTFNGCLETRFMFLDLDDHCNDGAGVVVKTLGQQFESFTEREIEDTIEARKLQARTRHSSEADMMAEVSHKPTSG